MLVQKGDLAAAAEGNETAQQPRDLLDDNRVHLDDSIGMIKMKIARMLGTLATSEMYMYTYVLETFQTESVYQQLTRKDKVPLTRSRLEFWLANLRERGQGPDGDADLGDYVLEAATAAGRLPMKEIYLYDDLLKLGLDGRAFWVAKPLGQRMAMSSPSASASASPNVHPLSVYAAR